MDQFLKGYNIAPQKKNEDIMSMRKKNSTKLIITLN